ncbi:protein N-terminal asparagine amidohydrolase isoform X1 [Drosophila sulfurigaster albostrigata]|uniref:protein N-terminal asparagine amidohydrolase isoform X1 n=1 Tax=Drosophila sulfurigaster albostrigata TaxID=89887 RepID=UPI002D21DBFB|nr:protein N-terminal asparagine amidohydrolase isoform X1 [Drosophila sulfurigaster albostrigata]
MVLVLNGVLQDDCPLDTSTLFLQHPVYRDYAQQLHSIQAKSIGPVGLLYVGQRELAAAAPHDKNINIIGADDATTCIIVVVRHSGSGAVALAHFDGSGVDEAVCTMVSRVQELALGYPEGRIELQLIGGYRDSQGYGEDVFYSIMQSFHKHHLEIDLTQACVGELNTMLRGEINCPIIYGVGVNIKTGEIFPATFPDRGPDQQLRNARIFMGAQTQVLDVYDSANGMLRIGPFNYDPLRGADLWLSQTDEFLLQHLSSSPDVEPPHFAPQTRATIRFIQENQFPAVTVFRDNRPRYYRRDDATGCWGLVRY